MRSIPHLKRVRRHGGLALSCSRKSPQGTCRLVAQTLLPLFPSFGLRRSHIGMLLYRYSEITAVRRRAVSRSFPHCIPRMSPLHLVIAATIAARSRVSSSVLASTFSQLQKPKCANVFRSSPQRLIILARTLAEPAGEFRDSGSMAFIQYMAQNLAKHLDAYGKHAPQMLCALAQAGGSLVFRRFSGDDISKLMRTICEQISLEFDMDGRVSNSPPLVPTCDLYCALSRLAYRDSSFVLALSRYLADHIDDLDADHLPALAQALGHGKAPFDDFVLLHGIARRSSAVVERLSGSSLISLLQIFGRYDLYDEEFMLLSLKQIESNMTLLSAGSLANAISALGSLKASDVSQLDCLSDTLRLKVRDLNEGDLVRCMRGLARLRHNNVELLHALEPVIEKNKSSFSSVSLTNVVSVISAFGITDEFFFKKLLLTVKSQIHRLSSASIQHILTALCRQQGRIPIVFAEECPDNIVHTTTECELAATLKMICAHLATPMVTMQISPVQAIGSLTALAKLKHRDLAAASVLLSVLAGRGGKVIWSWAPSVNFYSHRTFPESPFNVERCRERLQKELDPSQLVEILQSIHRLDLHSTLSLHLAMLLCKLLMPHLHELRAREVLVVTRAIGACQIPGQLLLGQQSLPEPVSIVAGQFDSSAAAQSASSSSSNSVATVWKEYLAESCLENLRRHEHYLEGNWFSLLPLKLLCLEIDSGAFGSRPLSEILSPKLLGFAERLRLLSRMDCELNKMRAAAALAEEDAAAATTPGCGLETNANTLAGASFATIESEFAYEAPEVLELDDHRVVTGGYISEFPVDVLIETRCQASL